MAGGWSWLPETNRATWSRSSIWSRTVTSTACSARPKRSTAASRRGCMTRSRPQGRAQGTGRLFTEVSELARRFFERKGFTVLERQDMILRGVPIHNYRMAKTLG